MLEICITHMKHFNTEAKTSEAKTTEAKTTEAKNTEAKNTEAKIKVTQQITLYV